MIAQPFRRLGFAILLPILLAAATTQPATRPAGWGEPVQGVAAHLRAERTRFQLRETPAFLADVQNAGRLDLLIVQSQAFCEIEFDGAWYRWVGDIDVKSSTFSPGKRYDNIPIALDRNWSRVQGEGRLKLTPGSHTLRVAFLPLTLEFEPSPIRAISNELSFEIR